MRRETRKMRFQDHRIFVLGGEIWGRVRGDGTGSETMRRETRKMPFQDHRIFVLGDEICGRLRGDGTGS
jgi:hypothetical protein